MLALAEYNRVLKCLHLLDYADDKQLRQVIQESLNRGEQLQGLKRALAACNVPNYLRLIVST